MWFKWLRFKNIILGLEKLKKKKRMKIFGWVSQTMC